MSALAQAHSRPIYVVRWRNFRTLLVEHKLTITAAASRLGKLQGHVSHFGGKNPIKPIGDQIASEIEASFNLPHGSLDNLGNLAQLSNALAHALSLVGEMQGVSANNSCKPKPVRGSA
jgi:hypothetical protein